MSEPEPIEELGYLRSEAEALRMANTALQRQMGADAEQTGSILRAMEEQARALQEANRRQLNQANFTQRVMDTSSALMIVLQPDGRIRQVNRRFTAEFGVADTPGEDFVLDAWLHPDEQHPFVAAAAGIPWKVYSPFFEFLRRSGSYAAEHRLAGRDGQYRFYWLEATLQHDPQGKEEGAVVCATDITQLKQQHERLLHSKAQLKEAQRIAQLGHWELDLVSDRVSLSTRSSRSLN